MKKRSIWLAAALLIGLAACGRTAVEVTPTPQPTIEPTIEVTAAPLPTAAAPVPSVPVTPAPTPAAVPETPEPISTPSPEPTPIPTPTPTPAPTPEPTPEVITTPEPLPTEPPARPSDEEVLSAYRAAEEAYGWFDLCTLGGSPEGQVEREGIIYTRVSDERFPNMDSFRGYLKTLFSDEVVDSLLPVGGQQYVEIDGVLYVSEGARGADITKGALILSVVWPQEAEPMSCTVRAEVELLDGETLSTVVGSQVYEFPYQRVGDKWVFTQFESIF